MGQITGGTVSFTRTTRPADFESKSATVTLTFETEDVLDHAAELAKAKVLQMVELKPTGKSPEVKVRDAIAATTSPETPELTQVTRAKIEAAARLNAADKAAKEAAPTVEPEPDPDGLEVVISDKQLVDTVQKAISKGVDAAAVKKLRSEYVQHPKGLKDIPADKRAEFLEKLSALK